MSLEPEQPISTSVLTSISAALQLKENVPPRLVYRAIEWLRERITTLELQARDATAEIDEARAALNPTARKP